MQLLNILPSAVLDFRQRSAATSAKSNTADGICKAISFA